MHPLIYCLLCILILQTIHSKEAGVQDKAFCNNSVVISLVSNQVPLLFNPLRVRLDWTIDGLAVEEVDKSCRKLKVELLHRPFEQFLPRPVLSNAVELDYDVEDGSRVLVTLPLIDYKLLEFDCSYFLRPGFYGLTIKGGTQTSSKWISLKFTSADQHPRLQLRNDSIFPHCQSDLIVSWSLPNCSPQLFNLLDFRIRVLAINTGISRNAEELLMEEFPLSAATTSNTIAIPCAQFDIIYYKFCFELISTERKTKHFELWDKKCVHTEPVSSQQQQQLQNSWSEWSMWSKCTSRGYSFTSIGYRKRRRHCSSHVNSFVQAPFKHTFCRGDVLQKENCSLMKTGVNKATFPVPLQPNVLYENASSNCECGCELSSSTGLIFIGSWKCSLNNTLKWTLKTKQEQRYILEVLLLFTTKKGPFKSKHVEEKLQLLRNNQTEVFWSNEDNISVHKNPFVLQETVWNDFTVQFSRTSLAGAHHDTHMNGVYFDYKLSPIEQVGMRNTLVGPILESLTSLGSHFIDCGGLRTSSFPVSDCEKLVVVVTALGCVVLALVLVVIPPLCCTVFTKKYTGNLLKLHHKKKGKTSSDSDALLSSYSQRSDMQRSGDTDCTHLVSTHQPLTSVQAVAPVSAAGRVSQRSIGIQLSRQSTPRSTSRYLANISQPISSTTGSGSGKIRRSTTISLANSATGGEEEEDGELEYDYYEPAHLPFVRINEDKKELIGDFEFVSQIDIDQIVKRETSDWLQELEQQKGDKIVLKQDAHTQI